MYKSVKSKPKAKKISIKVEAGLYGQDYWSVAQKSGVKRGKNNQHGASVEEARSPSFVVKQKRTFFILVKVNLEQMQNLGLFSNFFL